MSDVLGTLDQLCWPYKGLPPDICQAATREALDVHNQVLAILRQADVSPELVAFALVRLDRCRDYGRDPLDIHVALCIELWRLIQQTSLEYRLRAKCVGALIKKLHRCRKQFLRGRGLKAMPWQVNGLSELESLRQLSQALDWKVAQTILFEELEKTNRGAQLQPPANAHHLVQSLARLVNELRHWTDPKEAEQIVAFLSPHFDPSQRSLVLFARFLLMAMPAAACDQYILDGRFFKWWELLPQGANSRFSLAWIAIPARAAKARWACGEPRRPDPVLPQDQFFNLLDTVAGTMCLPVGGGKQCDLEQYTEDCQWAFLGKTTYRFVAKFFAYSLEPLEKIGQSFPEGSTWSALEMMCRRISGGNIHSGAWTWHVWTFLFELCQAFYVRVCRERYEMPGCLAHESFRLTPASDEAFIRLVCPLLLDTLSLHADGNNHLQTGITTSLSWICRLAISIPACWETLKVFLAEAVQDLADPLSNRHTTTFHLLSSLAPVLVYAAPGILFEAIDYAFLGVDPTDPMKTMIVAAFFVNLFAQVPTVDLSQYELPDSVPFVLAETLPLHPNNQIVLGTTPGELKTMTSTMPDICHNLLDRFLDLVVAQAKPSKKDPIAALELAGPRLLSTALFLAAKQADDFVAKEMGQRLAEWLTSNLVPNARKAVGMLVGAFALGRPGDVKELLDAAIKKLSVTDGGFAHLGETEVLWYIHVLGSAARFSGKELISRKEALRSRLLAAVEDKRKAVRKAGAKLLRRLLAGALSPYTNDLTGDATLEETLSRWAGARSVGWASAVRPIDFHVPSEAERVFANDLISEYLAWVKRKVQGSDEDIYTALCVIKSISRGTSCLYPDERQGSDAVPAISGIPNDWGPKLLEEFSEVLLSLCPRLGSPEHPFESPAMQENSRSKLLGKAIRLTVVIIKIDRRPEVPDLFQIRGFEGNARNHVASEPFTHKVHFMGAWRDVSRVWYNWEVLTLMNRRLHNRPTGFELNGIRRKLANLLCSYTHCANNTVSSIANDSLQTFLQAHYAAKKLLLHECFIPMQEKTIKHIAQLSNDQTHLAEAALQGFSRSMVQIFVSGSWRGGAAKALSLAAIFVRTIHAFAQEGKLVDIRPMHTAMLFKLIAKWNSAQAASNPGCAAEACDVAKVLLDLFKKPTTHWRTKVCILATVGSALRVLHMTDPAKELDCDVLQSWIRELIAVLESDVAQPQMASIAIADLTAALRSAAQRPGLPIDRVLQELIPIREGFLAKVAKSMSGLHQGHMGEEGGAVAQADSVQPVVQAASGRIGVPHLAWMPCPSGHAWTIHVAFFHTYATFCYRRGDTHITKELQDLIGKLQSRPKNEVEDHVVLIEALGGVLRASRRWTVEQQNYLWSSLCPVVAEELRSVEESNINNWRFCVYYVIRGVSRRLRPKVLASNAANCENYALLRLASLLCGSRDGILSDPVLLPAASDGDGEASSHAYATRVRLLQVLLVCLQRNFSCTDATRATILKGVVPALKEGVAHPYKQVHEESAKALVLSLCLGRAVDQQLEPWICARAAVLSEKILNAPKESDDSVACEGLLYIFIHGLLKRRLRHISLDCVRLLVAASAANNHDLRSLAGLALNCLGQSPHRHLGALALAQKLVDVCQPFAGEDSASAQRTCRLESACALLGNAAMRHCFRFHMAEGGAGLQLCQDTLFELLGDRRVEVRAASQSALAPLIGLEPETGCKALCRRFAADAQGTNPERAVHGLGAMLRVAGGLGVPPWLGDLVEVLPNVLSRVGRLPTVKKEVERNVQAFLKQQQQSRNLWTRCQKRLTEDQMDILKARQGTMSYFS